MSASKKQKCQVTITMFNKWQTQLEREHQTLSWLRCDIDTVSKELMDVLWCDACRKHERSITGIKNFSRVWLEGSSSHKTSYIVNHANSDQHQAAMIRVRSEAAKATSQPMTSYSPIAQSLLRMDDQVMEHMKKKFDICYLMAKKALNSINIRPYMSWKHDMVWILASRTRQRTLPRTSPISLRKASAKIFSTCCQLLLSTAS